MPTLDDIFSTLPQRFRPAKAAGLRSVVHFEFSDAQPRTVIIEDGRCRAMEGLRSEPTCTVRTDAASYVQLETGELNPQMALMTGRVRVTSLEGMVAFVKCFRRFGEQAPKAAQAPERPAVEGPFSGIRILDLTKLLPGPLATLMLASQGAEVIKVEDPASPDPLRTYPPFKDGESVFHGMLNRGKRSITADLSSPGGKQQLLALAAQCDVVMEQYRPGVISALGLGYEALREMNPRIILVSITGYGQHSPMAKDAGHDINYLAVSGMLDSLRTEDGTPVVPTAQIADVAGGSLMAVNAVATALFQRERTGRGCHVDVGMTDVLPLLNSLRITEERSTGSYGAELSGAMASYGVYACADGRHLALGALEPKFWAGFCRAVGRPEWEQRILDTGPGRSTLKAEVAALFLQRTSTEWLGLLEGHDICITPVLPLAEAIASPHFRERGITGVDGMLQFPFQDGSGRMPALWPAPALGEDNAAYGC